MRVIRTPRSSEWRNTYTLGLTFGFAALKLNSIMS